MMKSSLEDIEINAAYMQLIYEHIQTLDIPANNIGLMFNSEEFIGLLDKATASS